jgi:hypothetical protein
LSPTALISGFSLSLVRSLKKFFIIYRYSMIEVLWEGGLSSRI